MGFTFDHSSAEAMKESAKEWISLGDYEENRYHDSYFWSVSFNPTTKQFSHEMTGSTAWGGTYGYYNPCRGGTPEELEMVVQELVDDAEKSILRHEWNELHTVRVGDTVRVNNKRSKNNGLTGKVFWIGEDKYQGYNYGQPRNLKFGVHTQEGKKFLSETGLEILSVLDDETFVHALPGNRMGPISDQRLRAGMFANCWRKALEAARKRRQG